MFKYLCCNNDLRTQIWPHRVLLVEMEISCTLLQVQPLIFSLQDSIIL
jgi:hypothetical protein